MDIDKLDLKQQLQLKIYGCEQVIAELEHLIKLQEQIKSYSSDKFLKNLNDIEIGTLNNRVNSYKEMMYSFKDELYGL